jgi:hypothetical protein
VAWARRHLQELEAEIGATPDYTAAIFFAQEFDPESSTIEVTLQGVPSIPDHWALLAADYLQNIRTSLNYLAWELSRWNLLRQGISRDPSDKTQFPINTKPGDFSQWRLPDLHPDHVAVICELQPSQIKAGEWAGGTSPFTDELPLHLVTQREEAIERHPLTRLVQLTNDDKHRTLQIVLLSGGFEVTTIQGRNCILSDASWGPSTPYLEDGAVWGTAKALPTGEGKPEVDMDLKVISADLMIGAHPWGLISSMWGMATEIIDAFESVFAA